MCVCDTCERVFEGLKECSITSSYYVEGIIIMRHAVVDLINRRTKKREKGEREMSICELVQMSQWTDNEENFVTL